MGYKAKRWPHYALWALEDVLAGLGTLDGHIDTMQEAAIEGNTTSVVVTGGRARAHISDLRETLIRAKTGEYT